MFRPSRKSLDNTTFWSLNQLNARGQAIDEAYGNGLWLQSTFKPLTGEMSARQSGTGGSSTNVQNLSYVWDIVGNLTERHDVRQSLIETADYDELNRMWRTIGPAGTFTYDYDAVGNIESRTDVDSSSAWTYTRNATSVLWTSANLPASLTNGTTTSEFAYAPDRSRWRQIADYVGGEETTLYIGGLLEKHTTPVRTHWKHLIATPSGEVQRVRRDDNTTDTFYMPSDHVGSVDAVLNAAGAVLVRTSFDAWGGRRDDDWVGVPSATKFQQIANTTRRGFGGHEKLDNVGLVHMNGRVYEPASGRMLSADPFVVPMLGSQGFNRYAYVGNGPLTYADPSGFSPDDPDGDPSCFVFCGENPGIIIGDRNREPNGPRYCPGWCVPDGNPLNNLRNGGVEKPEEITASVTADPINVSAEGGVILGGPPAVSGVGDFDAVTEYIFGEMIVNAQGNQAQFVRSFLTRPSTVPQAYANWAALVRPGAVWDHKPALNPSVADNPSQPRFTGVQAEWYAHSFKAYGSYRYDVWSNIHFGFVGASAGFSADVLADGAGVAQLDPGSWGSVWSTMQNGGLMGMRRYDDPADQAALMLGYRLFQRYGTNLTLDQLRYEVLRWPDLARAP